MFASGSADGSILFWVVGSTDPQDDLAGHESSIWSIEWHPVGHILASGSNDHSTKFWARNRPTDILAEKYVVVPKANQKGKHGNRFENDDNSSVEPPQKHQKFEMPSTSSGVVIPGVPFSRNPPPVPYNNNMPPPRQPQPYMPPTQSFQPKPQPSNFRAPNVVPIPTFPKQKNTSSQSIPGLE